MSGGIKDKQHAKWVMASHKGRPQQWAGTNERHQNGDYGQNDRWRIRAGAENGASLATKEEYVLALSHRDVLKLPDS